MKKKLFYSLISISTIAFISFSYLTYDAKKNTGEVDQLQGVYVFVNSKPVMEYDYLGTVKLSMSLGSGQFTDVRDGLIKKLKKDYPSAEGVIFSFNDGGTDKCDAIKFK